MYKIKQVILWMALKFWNFCKVIAYYFVMFYVFVIAVMSPWVYKLPISGMDEKYQNTALAIFAILGLLFLVALYFLHTETYPKQKPFEKIFWMLFLLIVPYYLQQIPSIHQANKMAFAFCAGGDTND